jgi:hypothetical protein
MFNLKKFYVSYIQDAGMFMTCHAIIEAPDLRFAKSNWVDLIKEQGYCCNPVGDRAPYEFEQLFVIPDRDQNLSTDKLLKIYEKT